VHVRVMVFLPNLLGKGVKGGAVSHVHVGDEYSVHTILKCQGDRWIFLPMLAVDGVVTVSDELLGEI